MADTSVVLGSPQAVLVANRQEQSVYNDTTNLPKRVFR